MSYQTIKTDIPEKDGHYRVKSLIIEDYPPFFESSYGTVFLSSIKNKRFISFEEVGKYTTLQFCIDANKIISGEWAEA